MADRPADMDMQEETRDGRAPARTPLTTGCPVLRIFGGPPDRACLSRGSQIAEPRVFKNGLYPFLPAKSFMNPASASHPLRGKAL